MKAEQEASSADTERGRKRKPPAQQTSSRESLEVSSRDLLEADIGILQIELKIAQARKKVKVMDYDKVKFVGAASASGFRVDLPDPSSSEEESDSDSDGLPFGVEFSQAKY